MRNAGPRRSRGFSLIWSGTPTPPSHCAEERRGSSVPCAGMTIARAMIFLFVLIAFLAAPSWAQRDSSAFEGKAWEQVERERDAIETAILTGEPADALVLSTSNLYLQRNSPAFDDVATSIFRAYAGLPLDEAQARLEFQCEQLKDRTNGLGWLAAGLAARAVMNPASAAHAFRCAASDEMCCRIPFTNILLFESLIPLGRVDEATAAYREAVHSASGDPSTLFQVRYKFAEVLRDQGRLALWRESVEACAQSELPLERAYGLQQQALYAWYQQDLETFERKVGKAVVANSAYNASTEWLYRWDNDRWKSVSRHLGYASAALEGATDGRMILDFESTAVFAQAERKLEFALERVEPWVAHYPLEEIDSWDDTRQLWGQRLHLFHNNLLGRLGRTEEALDGFRNMLPYARDNYHTKFEPHVYCQMGYALKCADRLEEAREAYETGLSILDVPGEVVDPDIAYYPGGRIGKKRRMGFVANYRHLMRTIRRLEGER
jgi:hypothetical protein